jgi:Coenzyme PQQ synthesis protein D (PqqD)
MPRPGTTAIPLEDSVGLYDDIGHGLFVLNRGAAAVWSRCDGTATFRQVVESLVGGHSGRPADIGRDAWLTLHELARHGLVTDASGVEGAAFGVEH